jgi:hypothetical protein
MKFIIYTMLAVAVLLVSSTGIADNIVVFPPGTQAAKMADIAKKIEEISGISTRGVTCLEPSPVKNVESQNLASARTDYKQARQFYKNMEFDKAFMLLESAQQKCYLKSLTPSGKKLLFNIYILKGAIYTARDNSDRAGQEFRSAHIAAPAMVIDPALYSPAIQRLFGKAVTQMEKMAGVDIKLISKPKEAFFKVDNKEAHDVIKLKPGRHIIEASLPGYVTAVRTVDIDSDGSGPPVLKIKLKKRDNSKAWHELRAVLYMGVNSFAGSGIKRLFMRFGIETVFFVEHNENSITLFAATPGTAARIELPAVQKTEDMNSEAFKTALFHALGIKPGQNRESLTTVAVNSDIHAVACDDTGETFIIKNFNTTNLKAESAAMSDSRKIFKSPWFWTSVGLAVSIATGVAVTMRVTD